MSGDGGDVWQSHKDGGVENKAECVIYDVWLQNRNVWRTSAHLQKPTQEVRGFLLHVAHGSLRFMWRPDVCPPVWIYTQSGDLRGSPPKKKIKKIDQHTHGYIIFHGQNKCMPTFHSLPSHWPTLLSACGMILLSLYFSCCLCSLG